MRVGLWEGVRKGEKESGFWGWICKIKVRVKVVVRFKVTFVVLATRIHDLLSKPLELTEATPYPEGNVTQAYHNLRLRRRGRVMGP